jgi:hypothetical protein
LQPNSKGHLVDTFIRAWLVVVTFAGLFAWGAATSRPTTFSSIKPLSGEEISIPSDSPVDLTGNELRRAVALYQFDAKGEVYEEHSPETEVVRLAPPEG